MRHSKHTLALFAILAASLTSCVHAKPRYAVPAEFFEAVSGYNETIPISRYLPEEDIPKITAAIAAYAKLNYGMSDGEYVVALRVTTMRDDNKNVVNCSYLLGGEKIGEARTLFSGSGADVQKHTALQQPFYVFDVHALADLKQLQLGWGPRSFRVFIDKNSLEILERQQIEQLLKD